ncbi:MAG: hypothetical protein K2Y27_06715 [Xanthobacteraceae bacterium]|nr:hypothetical protein [Xanthobacteraceae bacterium]
MPISSPFHYERGILYRMTSDREHVIADFRKAVQRYPYCAISARNELQALGAEPASRQGVLDLLK